MKKILLRFSIVLLLLSACSSGNEESPAAITTDGVLIKKIIQLEANGKLYTTTIFTYDGNKIVNEIVKKNDISMGVDVGFNYRTEYTYSGNLITNIKVKNIFREPEKLICNTDFVYDSSGNLASSLKIQSNNIIRVEYGKLDANSIKCKIFGRNSNDNIETLAWEGKLTFDVNRNLIKSESMDSVYLFGLYTYDSKMNPKKNILGLNKLLFLDTPPNFNSNHLFPFLDRFNGISKATVMYYPTITNEYTYGPKGYPTEMKRYFEYLGNNNLDAIYQYSY